MRARQLVLLALLLGGAPGCHSYLLPFDERPLRAETPLPTRGGARLDLDDGGELILRPGAGDVAAALGVGLHPDPAGLVVTHRLRPDARLQPEDRIVYVSAVVPLPTVGRELQEMHAAALRAQTRTYEGFWLEQLQATERSLADKLGSEDAGDFEDFDPTELAADASGRDPLEELIRQGLELAAPDGGGEVASPAQVRARAGGHPVRELKDLRGYLCGLGWLELDLIVMRGGQEWVVRESLREEPRQISVRPWQPQLTRWHGFDLMRVSALPPEHRPLEAHDQDWLVTRVARDAPAGAAGLRPLDLVPPGALPRLLDHEPLAEDASQRATAQMHAEGIAPRDGSRAWRVQGPHGARSTLDIAPRELPTQFWFPFLLSYQSDGARTHLGLGPLDLLFHYSSRRDYEPISDAYQTTWRMSVAATIQGSAVRRPSGVSDAGGINLIVDGARVEYLGEWSDARSEGLRRRGLGGE